MCLPPYVEAGRKFVCSTATTNGASSSVIVSQ
jgi:hypothetical protein